MKAFAILIGALALAACQQPARPLPADNGVASNGVIETANEAALAGDTAATNASAPTIPPFAETPNAHPYAPVPAPIPAKFRGTWADSKADCANLAHPSRLTVSGKTVRFIDHVIFGDSFSFPQPNAFALKGHIEATGAPAEAHYSINAAGDVLTDEAGGGMTRVRCA